MGYPCAMADAKQFIRDRSTVDAAGCWLWNLSRNEARGGYGMAKVGGVTQWAHRLSYVAHVGSIPEGLELDHQCSVPACVNPAHLEPVTRAENNRRRAERGRSKNQNSDRTTCGKCGEPFDMVTSSGRRTCRTCVNAYYRAWRAKRKAGG